MDTMSETRSFLRTIGLPGGDATDLPTSTTRFPDGAQVRVEIPSVEGPRCLEAVLAASEDHGIIVHRASQGSGAFMLSRPELLTMAGLAATAQMEVSLFARPSAGWGTSATARTSGGAGLAAAAHGQEQVVHALEDARRAAAHGFRSVLISDIGVLRVFDQMRRAGLFPETMQAKVSVAIHVANATIAMLLCELGADSINLATDCSLAEIAAIRSVVTVPLDVYIESPDSVGGYSRQYEVAELVRVGAPIYLKFGLRNAPDIYPSGTHLEAQAVRASTERVRRAAIGLELLRQYAPDSVISEVGAEGLAIPVVDPAL